MRGFVIKKSPILCILYWCRRFIGYTCGKTFLCLC